MRTHSERPIKILKQTNAPDHILLIFLWFDIWLQSLDIMITMAKANYYWNAHSIPFTQVKIMAYFRIMAQ
jgi:hypothetical protein